MFKIGEIVRVGEAYNNFKSVGNSDFERLTSSYVVLGVKKKKMWDEDLIFYDIQDIETNEIYEDMGDVWLNRDRTWYRKQKLIKIKEICSNLKTR